MAIPVQDLMRKLNIIAIDLSKLEEARGLFFNKTFIFNAENVDLRGCVFYRCTLVGTGFDHPSTLFIECNSVTEMTLKDVFKLKEDVFKLRLAQSRRGHPISQPYLDLSEANLEGVFLQKAYLYGANLQGANLQGANLQHADFSSANLQGTNLEDANMRDVNLFYANLEGAYLQGANLEGVLLEGANLQGANLQGTNLKGANLRNASYDLFTKGLSEVRKRRMRLATVLK